MKSECFFAISYTVELFESSSCRGDFMVKEYMLDENYISVDEAAEYLGIKTVTLRNWIKKKPDIPAHRIGKFWKFKRSELDEWIASGKSAE